MIAMLDFDLENNTVRFIQPLITFTMQRRGSGREAHCLLGLNIPSVAGAQEANPASEPRAAPQEGLTGASPFMNREPRLSRAKPFLCFPTPPPPQKKTEKKLSSCIPAGQPFAMTLCWFHMRVHLDVAVIILSLIPLLKL